MIFKIIGSFLIFFLVLSCNQKTSKNDTKLTRWISSIEQKDVSNWKKKVSFYPDSVYNSFRNSNVELNSSEFDLIKKISENKNRSIELTEVEASYYPFLKDLIKKENEYFSIKMIPLDSLHPLKQYILVYDLNSDWNKKVHFFSMNHKLGEYKVSVKTIIEAQRFDSSTLIIGQVFQSGTGVYWLQNHFFQFTENNVKPVLQTVSSSYQYGWGCMDHGIQSTIISKNPLKITFEKRMEFRDSLDNDMQKYKRVDTVLFDWNASKLCFQPSSKTKFKYENNTSYYVGANFEYLIQSNIHWFKPLLKSKEGLSVLNQLYKTTYN